eukprot:2490036-Rhodomonas_salina.2
MLALVVALDAAEAGSKQLCQRRIRSAAAVRDAGERLVVEAGSEPGPGKEEEGRVVMKGKRRGIVSRKGAGEGQASWYWRGEGGSKG